MAYSEMQLVEIPQKELMADARESLTGRWGLAVTTFLGFIVISAVAGIIPLVPIIIAGPFALGLAGFSLRLARNQEAEFKNIFDGFQNFGNALGAYLLMILMIVLGFICLIIPGIIAALGLSQTMFILADEPDIGPVEALKKSWEMMKGYKMDFFILGIRFIPWALLCLLTLGIGFFWLAPYVQVTYANFYDALSYAQDPDAAFEDDDDISRHLVD